MYDCSFFLPEELVSQSDQFFVETKDFIHGKFNWFKNPILTLYFFKEGNMANISPTIKFNISTNLEIVEEIMLGASCSPEEVPAYKALFPEFCDIFSWSYTEIPGLDPSIMEHHTDTWLDVSPICQKKRPIHPSEVATVKSEIEKLLTTDFIYPIVYTTWVSNHVPVNKK